MTKLEWLELGARRKVLIELYAKEGVTEEMLFGKLKPDNPGQPKEKRRIPVPRGGEWVLR